MKSATFNSKLKLYLLLSFWGLMAMLLFLACSKDDGPREIRVETINIVQDGLTLKEGETFKLDVTIILEDAEDKGMTWKSGNEALATVDATGVLRAVSVGTSKITVVSKDNEDISDELTVTVERDEIAVGSVAITGDRTAMAVGDSFDFDAEVLPANATNKALVWSVDNGDVAEVDATTGVVTTKSAGSFILRVTSLENSELFDEVFIPVIK